MFYTHSCFQAAFLFFFWNIFQAEILSPFNTGAHTDRQLCRRVTQRSHLKLNQRLRLDTQAFTRQQRHRPRVVFLKSALQRSTSYFWKQMWPKCWTTLPKTPSIIHEQYIICRSSYCTAIFILWASNSTCLRAREAFSKQDLLVQTWITVWIYSLYLTDISAHPCHRPTWLITDSPDGKVELSRQTSRCWGSRITEGNIFHQYSRIWWADQQAYRWSRCLSPCLAAAPL